MANIYWGDTFHKPDGNWNHAANWYLTLGNPGRCCGGFGGTPANRVPQAGDSVVIVGGTALDTLLSLQGDVTTGPTSGWAGPLSFYESTTNFPSNSFIRAGTYSGTVTVGAHASYPTLFSGLTAKQFGIGGGTFTGLVNPLGKLNQSSSSGGWQIPVITGGTYSPAASCTLNVGNVLVDTNFPVDPGFSVGGGTFSPTISVSVTNYPPVAAVLLGLTYGPVGSLVGSLLPGYAPGVSVPLQQLYPAQTFYSNGVQVGP